MLQQVVQYIPSNGNTVDCADHRNTPAWRFSMFILSGSEGQASGLCSHTSSSTCTLTRHHHANPAWWLRNFWTTWVWLWHKNWHSRGWLGLEGAMMKDLFTRFHPKSWWEIIQHHAWLRRWEVILDSEKLYSVMQWLWVDMSSSSENWLWCVVVGAQLGLMQFILMHKAHKQMPSWGSLTHNTNKSQMLFRENVFENESQVCISISVWM